MEFHPWRCSKSLWTQLHAGWIGSPASAGLWFSAAGFPHMLFTSPFFHTTISFLPPAKTLGTWRKHTLLSPNFILKNSSFEKFNALAICKAKMKRTLRKSRKDIGGAEKYSAKKKPTKPIPAARKHDMYQKLLVADISELLFSSIPLLLLLEKLPGLPWQYVPQKMEIFLVTRTILDVSKQGVSSFHKAQAPTRNDLVVHLENTFVFFSCSAY